MFRRINRIQNTRLRINHVLGVLEKNVLLNGIRLSLNVVSKRVTNIK